MAWLLALTLGWAMLGAGAAEAAETKEPEAQSWPHIGIFGTYDRGALQRGLQVYTEVCASCHALRRVYFRNLIDIGFTEDEARAYAAQFEVEAEPDAEGEVGMRAAKLSDTFVPPFANENEARAANNGALPPDLSLITKARGGHCELDFVVVCLSRTGGEDYVHAVLTGYVEPPEDVEVREGMEYNPYFTGTQIAMPAPLDDDAVEFADGTPATVDRMSRDVTQFLAWAAEPTLEARKRLGFKVIVFLIILSALLYFVKRKVWNDVR